MARSVRRIERLVSTSSTSAPPRPGTMMASAGPSWEGPPIQRLSTLASGVKPPTRMIARVAAPNSGAGAPRQAVPSTQAVEHVGERCEAPHQDDREGSAADRADQPGAPA